MRMHAKVSRFVAIAAVTAGAALAAIPVNTWGDPPPWAPAHGWRRKHDPYYIGYTGKRWGNDYGILGGRCNRAAVGAVLGATAGAAIGSQIGRSDNRAIAMLVGAAAGALLGSHIGRDMDRADGACIGHTLELARDNTPVYWRHPDTGLSYVVTPGRGFQRDGQLCREFDLRGEGRGRSDSTTRLACRAGNGIWRVAG